MDKILSFITEDVLKARVYNDERDEIFLCNSIPWLGIDQAVGLRLPSLWFWLQILVVSVACSEIKYCHLPHEVNMLF